MSSRLKDVDAPGWSHRDVRRFIGRRGPVDAAALSSDVRPAGLDVSIGVST